jgi:hypothetical protein
MVNEGDSVLLAPLGQKTAEKRSLSIKLQVIRLDPGYSKHSRCGILPHFREEWQDAAATIGIPASVIERNGELESKPNGSSIQRRSNPHRQKLDPKTCVTPVKTAPPIELLRKKPRIPES